MDARLIDLERARQRPQSRPAPSDPRARWLAELRRWPAPFRRRLGPLFAKTPNLDERLTELRLAPLNGYAWNWLESIVREIHRSAAHLREARRRGYPGRITRRAHELEAAKAALLEQLFGRRMRNLYEAATRPVAREWFARERGWSRERAERERAAIARAEDRLRVATSEAVERRARRARDLAQRRLEAQLAEIARIEANPRAGFAITPTRRGD